MEEAQQAQETEAPQNTYVIRPTFKNKFPKSLAEGIIRDVLKEKLEGLQYHAEKTSQWTTQIADEVKVRLKVKAETNAIDTPDLELDRYKLVVQVLIGEQRGEGVRMGCRCFWDSDSDRYAQNVFMNDTLFCVCAAYGVYHY